MHVIAQFSYSYNEFRDTDEHLNTFIKNASDHN